MKPALTPARQRVAADGAARRRSDGQAGRISLYWTGDPNGCVRIADRGSRIAANVKKCPGRIRSHKLPRLLDRGQWIAVRLARHAGAGPRQVYRLKTVFKMSSCKKIRAFFKHRAKKDPHDGGPDQVQRLISILGRNSRRLERTVPAHRKASRNFLASCRLRIRAYLRASLAIE